MKLKLEVRGDTLIIGGIKELTAANATTFCKQIRSAMSESVRNVEIDLSQTMLVDSRGLGALIWTRNIAHSRRGLVRLQNPVRSVESILEQTRLHYIVEIVHV